MIIISREKFEKIKQRAINNCKFSYKGPGNNWDVFVYRSNLTGKKTQLSNAKFRTCCTFVKTHNR